MHYQIFVPGVQGSDSGILRNVGLGDLLSDTDSGPDAIYVHRGPDGRDGMAFAWRRENEPIGMDLNTVWTPAPKEPDRGLEAGRYFLGVRPADPPQPKDLIRRRPIPGHKMTLADGFTWLIPTLGTFPSNLSIDAEGNVVEEVKEQYRAYVAQGMVMIGDLFGKMDEVIDRMAIAEEDRGQYAMQVTMVDGLRFIVAALAVNYRVNFEIAMMLQLLDQRSAAETIIRICELGDIAQVVGQKKTLDPITIHAGSLFSAGSTAATPGM